MAILVVAPDLFSKPSLEPVPGARIDHRVMNLSVANLSADNVYAMGILPANCKLMHCILETQQLDAGTSAQINVGILNNYPAAMHTNEDASAWAKASAYSEINLNSGEVVTSDAPTVPALIETLDNSNFMFAGDVTCRTGDGARSSSSIAFTNAIGVSNQDRIIAVRFGTLPGTPNEGTLGLILFIDAA